MSDLVLLRASARRPGSVRRSTAKGTRVISGIPLLTTRRKTSHYVVMVGGSGSSQQGLDEALMRRVLLGMLNRMTFIAFQLWVRMVKDLKVKSRKCQKRCMLRFLNRMLGLAFGQWVMFLRHQRLWVVFIRVTKRALALGWLRWRQVQKYAMTMRRFLEIIARSSSAGRVLLAFKRWKDYAPHAVAFVLAVRPRRGHCQCVYQLLKGSHCRCGADAHLVNRMLKLRESLDLSLARARRQKHCKSAGGSKSVGGPAAGGAGAGAASGPAALPQSRGRLGEDDGGRTSRTTHLAGNGASAEGRRRRAIAEGLLDFGAATRGSQPHQPQSRW